jgi:hypothetical protein
MDGIAVPLYERAKLMNSLLYAPMKNITPATTLERTAAMLTIGWTDLPFRKFCREVLEWLLNKYDPILYDDDRWIMAKCQIQTDNIHYRLFVGKSMPMRPQSCLELGERLIKPNKSPMNGTMRRQRTQGRNPQKTKKRRGARRARNGTPNGPRPSSAAGSQRPRIRQRNGKSRRKAGRSLRNPSSLGGEQASTSRLSAKTCTIVEDEYIAEIVGGGTGANFNNTAYPINPGQVGTFPWLSKIAQQWEKYHFNMLEFYYKPEVTGFATAGTTGKVIFSVDFDASDSPPASKQQMEDTIPHVDSMPSVPMRMPLAAREMHALYPTLYVRPGGLPGASDIKTFDAGNLNIATQGLASNGATLGELRVRYNVTLSVPVLESATTAPANNSVVVFQSSGPESIATSGVTQTLLLAQAPIGSLGAVNTAGSIIFPAGNYKFDSVVAWVSAQATSVEALVEKNGVSINVTPSIAAQTTTTVTTGQLPATGFFTSDGTAASAITVRVIAAFAGGTCTAAGTLVVLAV